MASLFSDTESEVDLLDAGAGVGMLTAAFTESVCSRGVKPPKIRAVVYEQEPQLSDDLEDTLRACETYAKLNSVDMRGEVLTTDFVAAGVAQLRQDLFAPKLRSFNRAILNPPYKKIRSDSDYRALLHEIGIETSNLYTAFLAIVIELLEDGGELVAITPRSFCNGPYFKPFRELLIGKTAIKRIHLFESREAAFSQDEVLQENVIFHLVKFGTSDRVTLSRTQGVDDHTMTLREVSYSQIIHPDDSGLVIHIPVDGLDASVRDRLRFFNASLDDLGVSVSTGKVVDFRVAAALRQEPAPDTVPLIYPAHMKDGVVRWPNPKHEKPQSLLVSEETRRMLLPQGYYVLVKRFSSKEEPRRIVAAVLDANILPASQVAVENHVNVFHAANAGLPPDVACGLASYLNSTLVDVYFRQFSGHTQVNATDLRMLRYPDYEMLARLGARADTTFAQAEIDALLEEELHRMNDLDTPDPVAAKQKIAEALEVLRALGMPKAQFNDRSALTLLALLDLQPDMSWSKASNPRIGITPIMDFCRDYYGTRHAPNTRETFRRYTMHQFIQAFLVVENPDQPDRPTNSPKWCYQVEPKALALMQAFGTEQWREALAQWQTTVVGVKQRYDREREMNKVPLQLADGQEHYLSPGNHSKLIREVVEEFAPRFVPGGQVIYIGDTDDKWSYFNEDRLLALGVAVDEHGKMPDVVIYDETRDWLVLVEAVTSHGPVDAKRREELARLFATAKPGLVYVTAFLSRRDMTRYLADISWETEVWVAEAQTHLIHFNGERYLGPYET